MKKNTKIRNRHRNRCSTATGKICGSLRTKLYFEIALQIARQALEPRQLSELKEKDEAVFTGADAKLDLCAPGIVNS